MAETGKKVEVRYGAFACRVEGFDDPVAPLREVLSLMQRIIAETPTLADQRPTLDAAQFARIGAALSEHRAGEEATPGIIVIRNTEPGLAADVAAIDAAEVSPNTASRQDRGAAQRFAGGEPGAPGEPAGDVANANVAPVPDAGPAARPTQGPSDAGQDTDAEAWHSADAAPPDRPGAESPSDAGPHPSAGVFAAPAAAAAEAAFAASVAAGAEPDSDRQGPLAAEQPGEPVTPAALFAAPAAEVAGTAFPDPVVAASRPADPDDDAGDPDLPWADEAADERVQAPAGAEALDAPMRMPAHGAEPPGTERAGAHDSALDPAWADAGTGAVHDKEAGDGDARAELQPAGPDALEPARSPGGPGQGWSPWDAGPSSGPGGATSTPGSPPSSAPGEGWRGLTEEPEDAGPAFREPAPGYDEDEALPAFNIFAPPPPDAPATSRPAAETVQAPVSNAPGRARTPLRHDLEAAANAEIVPDPPTAEAAERRRPEVADADAQEVLDDGAGDWLEDEPDGDESDMAPDSEQPGAYPDVGPDGSAENRLAALITRYQSGLHGHAPRAVEPDVAGASLTAAELAERAGATEVEDLLAVAAAWLTLADGRARFTRRDVMEVFETLPGGHPRTLEARIKGFGGLVRSGTLQLGGDGAFSLAPHERARFRALVDQG